MRATRRRVVALAVAGILAGPLFVLAEATVESLGFDPEELRQSLFGALRGQYWVPDFPDALRVVPDPEKVAAIEVLGRFAKSYFASAAFRTEYHDAYKKDKPRGFALPSFSTRALSKTAVDKARGNEREKSAALDKDPRRQLRKRLEAFLAATVDVDFSATTHASGTLEVFDKAQYESKPPEWKVCYRAGKATTEALRAFARSWLAELK